MELEDRISRRVKLRDLHMLEALSRHGSMAKAATELAISQAAVSKAVSEMERLLEFPVLERSPRGIRLTEAGNVLLGRARIVFDEIACGLRDVSALTDPAAGRVRVGIPEPQVGLLSRVIDRTTSSFPGIVLEIVVSDGESLLRLLRQRELDLVVARHAASGDHPDLDARTLHESPLVVLAAKSHPLATRRRLKLGDLSRERWTLSPSSSPLGLIVARTFSAEGMQVPAAAVTALSIYMRLALVSGGRFLTMVPQATAEHSLVRGWAKALPVPLAPAPGSVCLIRLKRRNPIGAVSTFCRLLEEGIGEYRAGR
ncbi:MAG: LysR family transcriptional regulator [Rubrivivax sp.]